MGFRKWHHRPHNGHHRPHEWHLEAPQNKNTCTPGEHRPQNLRSSAADCNETVLFCEMTAQWLTAKK